MKKNCSYEEGILFRGAKLKNKTQKGYQFEFGLVVLLYIDI